MKSGLSMDYLPMLELAGTEFFYDARLKELRQVGNGKNSIAFTHIEDAGDGKRQIWYDTQTKNAVDMPVTKEPAAHIVCLEFPTTNSIDRLTSARKSKVTPTPPYLVAEKQVAEQISFAKSFTGLRLKAAAMKDAFSKTNTSTAKRKRRI